MPLSSYKYNLHFDAQDAVAGLGDVAQASFRSARRMEQPFRHWLFENALPMDICHAILALPIAPPRIEDTYGKRDSHNDMRRFFSPAMQAEYPAMHEVATVFQDKGVIGSIETMCGISLAGSYLRIEYCQDREGFWLEPHKDIKEKHITIQIYLNRDADADSLGTDLYDSAKSFHSRAPGAINQGMAFLPSTPESWHGFEKRPIQDVRRSLIINYVTDDWRARHELAFPEHKI